MLAVKENPPPPSQKFFTLPQNNSPQHPTYQDVWLGRVEYTIVMLLSLAIILTISLYIIQIFSGVCDKTTENLSNTLDRINGHWQICLIILLPLFFRPTRNFLEKMRKFGGVEAQNPEHEGYLGDYNKKGQV